jgi:uncharacterized membrane protein YccC
VTADLLRNTFKLATAAFITAAVAVWTDRITYVWYPLMAVVVVVDDHDEHTVQAAMARVLGTVAGGLITFLVHSILSGWPGVLVSMLLIVPLLRALGWQSAISTAALVSVMFLMIPGHAELNWGYVFNRALDTAIGCLIAIGVGLLFWPRNGLRRLAQLEQGLRRPLQAQLAAYGRWLSGTGERPRPLDPGPLTSSLLEMERLLARESRGPSHQDLRRLHWAQRLQLWGHVHHHWIAWERLLAALPDPLRPLSPSADDPLSAGVMAMEDLLSGRGPRPCTVNLPTWQALSLRLQVPLLLMLALAEEQRPLQASFSTLRLLVPWR